MNGDDIPVVGDDTPTTSEGARITPATGWAAAATLAMAIGIVTIVGTPTAGPEKAPHPSSPTLPSADDDLEWHAITGLASARHVVDIVPVEDGHVAIGTSADGVRTWTSADGIAWAEHPPLDGTNELTRVADVAAADGRVAFLTTTYDSETFRRRSEMWIGDDGEGWASRPLSSPDQARIEVVAEDVAFVDGTIAVRGRGTIQPDPQVLGVELPPGVRALLADGELELSVGGNRLEVRLPPGRVVFTTPVGDIVPNPLSFRGTGPLAWQLTEHAGLTADMSPAVNRLVTATGNGRLVGLDAAGRVVVTDDGNEWRGIDVSVDGIDHVPFRDGLAAIDSDQNRIFAVEGLSRTLLEPGMAGGEWGELTDLASDGVGIAAVAATGQADRGSEVVVAGDADTMLVLGASSQIEVLESGDTAFYGTTATAPLRLDAEDGSLEVVDPRSGVVLLELTARRWIRALRESDVGSTSPESAHLLHAPDGESWTAVPWHTISRLPQLVDPDVFMAGDVVVAVDQGVDGGPIVGAWAGVSGGLP